MVPRPLLSHLICLIMIRDIRRHEATLLFINVIIVQLSNLRFFYFVSFSLFGGGGTFVRVYDFSCCIASKVL